MYKKFISKISLALLSSLVIIQSCQIPNVSDNKNQASSSKIGTFNTKAKVIHLEDYSSISSPYIFGFTYNKDIKVTNNVIHLFQNGEADPNWYFLNENISNTTEPAGGSIRYDKTENKWVIGLFSHYLDIPAKGGSIKYQDASEDGRYTEDHNVDLSISDNEITIKLHGKIILNESSANGPYSVPTHCEGTDLLIHSIFCYYHAKMVQESSYNTTIKLPLRTSEINLSIPDKELGCGVKSTDIGVTADSSSEGWTLEISEPNSGYRRVIEDARDRVIKFDSETLPVGTYQVKAFYTNHPESAESDTIKVIPSDQCPNECDCNNNLNGFGIKAYPNCDKKPCPDPLLYPNKKDPYKNCPSFAKDQKENKSTFFPTESIVIGVYDFDSGEGKPNLTVVLRPNGNNNHSGGFGDRDISDITTNNLDKTKVYVKEDTNKTNLLITPDTTLNDPPKNRNYNHDALTGTIEIDTSNKLKKSSRASFKDILNRPEYNKEGTVENKIISDLSKNITSILKDDKGNNFRENNNVFSHVKPDGTVWNSVSNSVVVDMPSNTLSLPVLGIKLDDVLKTMNIGDTKTIVLENQGNFIEIKLKYRGKNKDNPNESVWEILCGRGN
jgi:hypothetical protein